MSPPIRLAGLSLMIFLAGHAISSNCGNFYPDFFSTGSCCRVKFTTPVCPPVRIFVVDAVIMEASTIPQYLRVMPLKLRTLVTTSSVVTFCSVIELSKECNSATVLISGNDISLPTQLHCDALGSQGNIQVGDIETTKDEITVKISTESDFGRYRIVCDPVVPTKLNDTQFHVTPAEVPLDSEVTLQLTVAEGMNSAENWCFVKTPDGNTEVLATAWVSETQVNCTGFNPVIPGVFSISLSSSFTPNVFEKAVAVNVTSKHPLAQQAEYSYDFKTIFVSFDGNIELHSACGSVFSESSHFGVGFGCSTKGNILVVRMGQGFKVCDSLEVTSAAQIVRAGCQNPEFCLFASPASLVITKPNVSGTNLSFSMNAACPSGSTRKHVSVKVTPLSQFSPERHPAPPRSSGKTQRRNLMTWRMLRQFQSKLSSDGIAHLNGTEVDPLVESLPAVGNHSEVGAVAVSVYVRSSPGGSSILAEAGVTFCRDSDVLFRYKWVVNDRDVLEDGKLLGLRNLEPGKYVVKCMVVDDNSSEVLGQAWGSTEILTREDKVVIVPSETTVGTGDDVLLRALTWHGGSVSWSCRRKPEGECLTTDGKLLSDVVKLTGRNVSVPGGSLPVGVYIWKVENAKWPNEATVLIGEGNVTAIGLEMPSPFVSSGSEVVVRATVARTQKECRGWWSSVRQKGFDYLHLNAVVTESPTGPIPLVIPSEDWKKAEYASAYLFRLQVFCPYSHPAYLKVPLVVYNPPVVSPLLVQPSTGEAMITNFSVSGGEVDASVDDHPLLYEWSYVDSCDSEVPIGRGAFSRPFTTYLPPGDLRLTVKVCSGKTCTTTSTPTISVIQSSEFPADNFRAARNQIERLMTSGDVLEASGLAVTVFKSLALLPETEIREEVYSTVEKAIVDRMERFGGAVRRDQVEAALELFERGVAVARYFRKGSDLLDRLLEFRKGFE